MTVNITTTDEFLKLTEDDIDISISMEEDEYDKFIFPKWIKIIQFYKYKYEIDNLPDKLESLYLGTNLVVNNLPMFLQKLSITGVSDNYNNLLNCLTEGLEQLDLLFSKDYSYKLNNLPNSLKILKINNNVLGNNKLFTNFLPSQLESLSLFSIKISDIIEYIPKNLKLLELRLEELNEDDFYKLPFNLYYLILHLYDGDIDQNQIKKIIDISKVKSKKIQLNIRMNDLVTISKIEEFFEEYFSNEENRANIKIYINYELRYNF